jgi:hypothetical protein
MIRIWIAVYINLFIYLFVFFFFFIYLKEKAIKKDAKLPRELL